MLLAAIIVRIATLARRLAALFWAAVNKLASPIVRRLGR
jgi:hypothetical protein